MLTDQPPGSSSRRETLLPLIAIAVTLLLWASAFVVIRHLGHDLTGGPMALGRMLVASLVLGVAVLIVRLRARSSARPSGPPGAPDRRLAWPRGAAWARLALCGLTWLGVYNVALNEGERRVDAGTAAMLVNVGPILLAILAGLLLREGFPRRLVVGTTVAFVGVVVIGLATSTRQGADWTGAALCVVAAVGYAIGVVAQKPVLRDVSALRVTWLASMVGALCLLPYAPGLVRELAAAGPADAAWVVYLGVGPTALAFTTWAYALARTSAGKQGSTTYLVPPIAVLLGWLLLGETPPLLAFAGGALCLVGVYVSRRGNRSSTSTAEPVVAGAPR